MCITSTESQYFSNIDEKKFTDSKWLFCVDKDEIVNFKLEKRESMLNFRL